MQGERKLTKKEQENLKEEQNRNRRAKETIFWAVAFLLAFAITLTAIIVNVTSNKTLKDYDDYSKSILRKSNLVSKQDEEYLVYIYSKDCEKCEETKKYVFQYLDSEYNSLKYTKLYLFCIDDYGTDFLTIEESKEKINGITQETIDDMKIYSFPLLIDVKDGAISSTYAKGKNAIITTLEGVMSS